MDIYTRGLQVYIQLEAFAQEALEELERRGLHIEVVEPTRGLIQARIPFDRLEDVSQLSFVKFIRLPELLAHKATRSSVRILCGSSWGPLGLTSASG